MATSFDFSGKVVAVTGAAVGIGAAVATAFGEAGAQVYLLDVERDRGAEVASRLGANFLACDVTEEAEVDGAFARISVEQGRLDVLVNNAGGFARQRSPEDLSVEEWREVVELNLTSVFIVTRHAIPLLRAARRGRVVNIGSLAGQTGGYRTSPAYAAAKAGVHALTRVLAHELAGEAITVNALAPSAVLTDRIAALRDTAEREATARSIPVGRYQTPEELAWWVLVLACEESGYLTGQTVSVNGGRFTA